MRNFTKEWLKAANDDLLTINEIVDNSFLTHITAFHAQQCVEKAMKAILEEYEIDYPKIHKLVKLKTLVPVELKDIDEDMLFILDDLYIESRYPGELGLLPNGKPTLEDAKEFYQFAQQLFNQICVILEFD
jgi:HEPN domain-containing protein